MNKTYEYEERAFLTEANFHRVKKILENEPVSYAQITQSPIFLSFLGVLSKVEPYLKYKSSFWHFFQV